jgi:hypothetical protein
MTYDSTTRLFDALLKKIPDDAGYLIAEEKINTEPVFRAIEQLAPGSPLLHALHEYLYEKDLEKVVSWEIRGTATLPEIKKEAKALNCTRAFETAKDAHKIRAKIERKLNDWEKPYLKNSLPDIFSAAITRDAIKELATTLDAIEARKKTEQALKEIREYLQP